MKEERNIVWSIGYHMRNGLKGGRQKEKGGVKQKDRKTKKRSEVN
jgi:hypothetical protein